MLILSGNKKVIKKLKDWLNGKFEMEDMEHASRILGMDIRRDREKDTLTLSHDTFIEKVLKTFGMIGARSVITPIAAHLNLRSLTEKEWKLEAPYMENVPYASDVESLMYAMVGSRPGLGFTVGFISRFVSKPSRKNWEAVKWVLKYLKGASKINL